MKYGPLALSFDFGTQSVRAILFDKTGEIRGKEKIDYKRPYFSVKPGYCEQTADFYWDNMCTVSKMLKESSGELWNDIVAMSVTSLRDVITCLDKNNNPLRPFILYLDGRRVENPLDYMPSGKKKLVRLAGVLDMCAAQYAATFSNWLAINEPNIWSRTKKVVMLPTYIHYKLLGKLCDSVANQVGHVPFNYKKKEWMHPSEMTYFIFGSIRPDMLVQDLKKPCEVMGYISKEVAEITGLPEGLPVIASGADKACETLAVGCEGPDVAAISMGTAASIEITTEKYVEPQPFLPAYPSIYQDKYTPEVLIFRGYWMISWFKNEFAHKELVEASERGVIPEKLLDEHLRDVPAGSDGLILQPFWSPGTSNPEAKGAVIGFADYHTRVHVYRAIIEGIGFALYDALKSMEKRAGYDIKRIMVSGGGANSDEVCQITADLFGCKVQKIQTYETSALGAAMASFTGVGEYKKLSDAVKSMSHITYEYVPNKENHEIYRKLYDRVYRKLYDANKKFYKEIREIIKH